MRAFIVYSIVAVATVALAVAEGGQHMGLYGFIAIFICQPWLAFVWVLLAVGVPIPSVSMSAPVIAVFAGLNILLWALFLFVKRRQLRSRVEP